MTPDMTPTTATPVLTVDGVSRRYRRGAETVVALDEVSLELFPYELTVVAGASGSGKTTLLSVVAGLERADSGRVLTHPPLPDSGSTERLPWRHLAFVPQAQALLPELTVWENVDLPARLDPSAGPPGGPDASWSADRLLDLLEIAHLAHRYPSTISGGEQQRTAIGRALRLRPALLLCDEPTGHQDRRRVELVLTVLRRYAWQGHAVVVASHDEAVIGAADRVITLADGRIVDERRSFPAGRGKP
jgi:putative ABC transport system ATP-binding protein